MAMTLKAARVNAGLTQPEAAAQLGVTKNTLSNWELSRSFPTVPQIKQIERLYGVEFGDLAFPDIPAADSDEEEASE